MIVPGSNALTRTAWGARSTCIDFVRARTAPFDAAYDTRRASPVSTIAEDMFTIEPERCAIIVGTTARDMRNTPRAFTRITCSHRSRLVSSTSPTPAMPALLTRTSMRPCSAAVAAASARVCSSSATSTRCGVPSGVEQVDYEAELAAVIGARVKGVSVENALEAVAGYTCLNDVSARVLQFADGQWTRAKSLDTFCPIGPRVVPRDEVGDPQSL